MARALSQHRILKFSCAGFLKSLLSKKTNVSKPSTPTTERTITVICVIVTYRAAALLDTISSAELSTVCHRSTQGSLAKKSSREEGRLSCNGDAGNGFGRERSLPR